MISELHSMELVSDRAGLK